MGGPPPVTPPPLTADHPLKKKGRGIFSLPRFRGVAGLAAADELFRTGIGPLQAARAVR
ncbi:MAG: hypothetical protein M3N51_06130 [Actinomycetota bacterium]|nr:hypothetical protein [Actinomycetota bacterium]